MRSTLSFGQLVLLYLITIPVFFIIDLFWLSVVATDVYQAALGHVLGEVNVLAAIIFYLVYVVGLLYFAVVPGLVRQSVRYVMAQAALFGFFTYATYDFTNLATVRDWPLSITLIDTAWGTFLCLSVGTISYLLARKLLRI